MGGGREGFGRVAAAGFGGGDTIAGDKFRHAGADGRHDAGDLRAEREGQRHRVESAALIRVDEVEARGLDADAHLAGGGRGHRNVVDLERFWSAGGMDADREHDGIKKSQSKTTVL